MAESPKRTATKRPAPIPSAVAELWALVVAYLKQETTEPLKSLGRVIAFGLAGSLAIGAGVVFIAIGGVRPLPGETHAVHRDRAFVAYLPLILLLLWVARFLFP